MRPPDILSLDKAEKNDTTGSDVRQQLGPKGPLGTNVCHKFIPEKIDCQVVRLNGTIGAYLIYH
jgi:hypothetical protein